MATHTCMFVVYIFAVDRSCVIDSFVQFRICIFCWFHSFFAIDDLIEVDPY